MKDHIIYVPGLGDHRSYEQPLVLWFWRFFGVKVHYLPLGWRRHDGWPAKQKRLIAKIDEIHRTGGRVSLIGVSAGASAVLNAYAASSKIHRVVCIVGKINNPQTVGAAKYRLNPDFKESVYLLQKNLLRLNSARRDRVMSIHPLADNSVPPRDTIIPGAVEIKLPVRGHVFTIFYAIVFKVRLICKFIRENGNEQS